MKNDLFNEIKILYHLLYLHYMNLEEIQKQIRNIEEEIKTASNEEQLILINELLELTSKLEDSLWEDESEELKKEEE